MESRHSSSNLPFFVPLDLVREVEASFALGHDSEHGPRHLKRVFLIGQYLAGLTGADKELVGLFALFHDSRRISEDEDPEHGIRAADYLRDLAECELSAIQSDRLNVLLFACEHHNDKFATSSDIMICTCWDSDRLDLCVSGLCRIPICSIPMRQRLLKP